MRKKSSWDAAEAGPFFLIFVSSQVVTELWKA